MSFARTRRAVARAFSPPWITIAALTKTGNRIYKSKYDEKEDDERAGRGATKAAGEKKPRDKSRTRTLFGRKKSIAA